MEDVIGSGCPLASASSKLSLTSSPLGMQQAHSSKLVTLDVKPSAQKVAGDIAT